MNGRPTTLANTSTQNSKIYSRFSLFDDLSTKRLWKSNLRVKTTYHHSKILLILWHAKLLRSERFAGSEMASGDVVQLSTGFEKETSNSSPCCETGAGAAAIGTQMSRLRPNFQTLRTDCKLVEGGRALGCVHTRNIGWEEVWWRKENFWPVRHHTSRSDDVKYWFGDKKKVYVSQSFLARPLFKITITWHNSWILVHDVSVRFNRPSSRERSRNLPKRHGKTKVHLV